MHKKGSKPISGRPTRPSRLNDLHYLTLLVLSLGERERFHVDVLGMEMSNRANEGLVYLACSDDNPSLDCTHAISNGLQTMDHYGFIVGNMRELKAWYRYLEALGVTLFNQPFDHGDGTCSFHLPDPVGDKV